MGNTTELQGKSKDESTENRLDTVENTIKSHPDPVVSSSDIAAEIEDLSRREVLNDLRLLERDGVVGSKKIGARAVAWWHNNRVTDNNQSQARKRINAALDDWQPGRNEEEKQKRRQSAQMAIQWLSDQSKPQRRADFLDALYDSAAPSEQSDRTWWEQSVLPALNRCIENDIVDRPQHGVYRYIG